MKDLQTDNFIKILIDKANEGIELVKKTKINSPDYNTLMNNTMNTIQVVLNKQQFNPQPEPQQQTEGLASLDGLIGNVYMPLGKIQ